MERSSPPSTTLALLRSTATAAAAGTGQQAAVINGVSDLRSDPVFQFTDVAYSGTYQATPYFTTAEVAVQSAAPNLNNPESGRQRSAGVTINGTVIAPSVVDDQRVKGCTAYAGDSPASKLRLTGRAAGPLPVRDLQFTAKPASHRSSPTGRPRPK